MCWISLPITKYDKRNDAHAQGAAQLEASGKYPVFKTKIRTSRKVSESTFARLPITVYSKRSNAAIRGVVDNAEVILIPHLFQCLFQPGLLLPRLIQ